MIDFMNTGKKEIDIPLTIDIEKNESRDKKPSYVFGFNDAKRGLIRLFSNYEHVGFLGD